MCADGGGRGCKIVFFLFFDLRSFRWSLTLFSFTLSHTRTHARSYVYMHIFTHIHTEEGQLKKQRITSGKYMYYKDRMHLSLNIFRSMDLIITKCVVFEQFHTLISFSPTSIFDAGEEPHIKQETAHS